MIRFSYLKKTVVVTALLFSAACSTTIYRPDLEQQATEAPQMIDYHDRWALGFIRSSYTNVNQACVNETPIKSTDFLSWEDFFISVLSIGIYTPATTHVWCYNN